MPFSTASVFFFCRYFVLYEYGGIYADCDVECLKPLESYFSGKRIVIAAEPDIHNLFSFRLKSEKLVSNAIMASQPRHPFFKYMIDTLENRTAKTTLFGADVMETTGPYMLVYAYKEYCSIHANPPPLVDSEVFQPMGDQRLNSRFKKTCDTLESQGIKNLVLAKKICVSYLKGDKITEKSLTVHHWTHSWLRDYKAGIDKKYTKFHINDLRKTKMLSKQNDKDVKSVKGYRRSLVQN